MLHANVHQGKFGEDYVRVLASAAGLIIAQADVDVDGVDFTFRYAGRVGNTASPGIDVQVKSWSRPIGDGSVWRFAGLDERQFSKLAGPDFAIPRFLFLVIVPPEADRYADVVTEGMVLRYQGYYLSLRDEDPIPSPSASRHRTVHVPKVNVLTPRVIGSLVHAGLASVAPAGAA